MFIQLNPPEITPQTSLQDLITALQILGTREQNLITDVKTLIQNVQNNLVNSPTPEDDQIALHELQQAQAKLEQSPTEYTKVFLSNVKANSVDGQEAALNLVRIYLETTRPLNYLLPEIKQIASNLDTRRFPNATTVANDVDPLIVARTNLEQMQAQFQEAIEENRATGKRQRPDERNQIEILEQGSKELLDLLDDKEIIGKTTKPLKLTIAQRFAQFIEHLKEARELLKHLSHRDGTMTSHELTNISRLLEHWERATQKLQALSGVEDLNNTQGTRHAVSQSIEIHKLLDENFNYIAEIFRTRDSYSSIIL